MWTVRVMWGMWTQTTSCCITRRPRIQVLRIMFFLVDAILYFGLFAPTHLLPVMMSTLNSQHMPLLGKALDGTLLEKFKPS